MKPTRLLFSLVALLVLGCLAPHAGAMVYNVELGRRLQRDPLGYADGPNQYEYVRSRAIVGRDPMGLAMNIGVGIGTPCNLGGGRGGVTPNGCGRGVEPGDPIVPPDTKKCCQDAQTNPKYCTGTNAAFAACCDGSSFICFCEGWWDQSFPMPGSKGEDIVRRCIGDKEAVHAAIVQCDDVPGLSFPTNPMKDRDCTECNGWTLLHSCLLLGLSECGNDLDCIDAINALLPQAEANAKWYCALCDAHNAHD
jgi:hypothetical protein